MLSARYILSSLTHNSVKRLSFGFPFRRPNIGTVTDGVLYYDLAGATSGRSFASVNLCGLLSQKKKPDAPSRTNLQVIKSMDTYEFFVYGKDKFGSTKLIVTYFSAKCSTMGKVIAPKFEGLADFYSNIQFLIVDVDECPRAAYHADVENVPTVVIMYGDDGYRKRLGPIDCWDSSNLISETKTAIDAAVKATAETAGASLLSKRAWYTYNTEIDNLNVRRLGWLGSTPFSNS